ncbi:MAG: TolB family protein [Rhodothermales bacterium]
MRYLLLLPLLSLIACTSPAPEDKAADTPPPAAERSAVASTLSVYDMASGEVRTVLELEQHFEAPNWTPDGQAFIFNMEGALYRIPVDGGDYTLIPTGEVDWMTNDHGLSSDGSLLAFTAGPDRHLYTMPTDASEPPTTIVAQPHSYWHGWSPDDATLVYTAQRNSVFDLYAVPVGGGDEIQLTFDEAHDDGPDYSPDGRWIYFNTDRTGNYDIWRLPAEGGDAEQITSDAHEDWFPHPSPDGAHIVMLSYEPGTEGHPANQNVTLRRINGDGTGEPEVLVELFGGQGTINVPSWAPDSHAFAFVQYRLLED